MDSEQINSLTEAVLRELSTSGVVKGSSKPGPETAKINTSEKINNAGDLIIDLPDPTRPEARSKTGVDQPVDSDGLEALIESTSARIGVGRAGPRFRTAPWLLFQSDLAVTQDALLRDVNPGLLESQGLFTVQTCVTGGKQEYLLRPDLGRRLSDEASRLVREKCQPKPNVQVCIGDGLSAQAIESNLAKTLPVIRDGCKTAGLVMGTPFFIRYCRVGVMNDIGDLLRPDVVILLIGERPGLGRADSMSIYMGYKPKSGDSDADRDVICNVFEGGGTNPLEAGAYAVRLAQKMIREQSSGVKLKIKDAKTQETNHERA